MKKLKLRAPITLRSNEEGLIPLLIAVFSVVIAVIIFAYIRVSNAN